MTPTTRGLAPFAAAPFAAAVALGLAACGGNPSPPSEPSASTATQTPTTQEADRPEQRQLTADQITAALPKKDEGPFPPDPKGFDAAKKSQRTADPEACLALYMDTPEMRDFRAKQVVGGDGVIYTSTREQIGQPRMSVALWSFDEAFPTSFFDQAGAALSDCSTHASSSPDGATGDWEATSIPTPSVGDQSFGVRIGRSQVDMAVDYLWVRSGHNLINVRMRTGYTQNNDQRLMKYAQGVLDDLKKSP